MHIGVLKQTGTERRVAINPETTKRLTERGHKVTVETGAGAQAGWNDRDFEGAGALIDTTSAVLGADLLLTVTTLPEQISATAMLGLLRPFDQPDAMKLLAGTGTTAFAFEAVPRTTRAQAMDALSSQATVAGYQAVIEAATLSDRMFPMLTTAAGTLPPAKVLVLGAGVAGLQAIATARRLGGVVSAFDIRAAAAEQVRSLGASFISLDIAAQDAGTIGGYAKEVQADEQDAILAGLAPVVADSDVVISTAAIPGRPAPRLITADMVANMRPGAVIVDLAAATGGNCALTKPGRVVTVGGVSIVGFTDLESRKANDASRMLARNVAAFVEIVSGDDLNFAANWDDDIISEACITRDGQVVHPSLTGS